MILELKSSISESLKQRLKSYYQAIELKSNGICTLVTGNEFKELDPSFSEWVDRCVVTESDIQLASNTYCSLREVSLHEQVIVGDGKQMALIAGPCSIESKEQILHSAKHLSRLGVRILRAGCYKPRTSPYSFQGMGKDGLKLLREAGDRYGMSIITEVRDATHLDEVIEYADIIQVGAKAMYDHGILRRCGTIKKPVLLKRSFGSTLQEFVQAAEFILCGGNPNVLLCERGIRTFETKTRFTLDLCGVAYLKQHINLPVILDPSHAIGFSYGVTDLACACTALGVDGLMIEVHPNPQKAKSDASQQIDFNTFTNLRNKVNTVAKAIGRKVI